MRVMFKGREVKEGDTLWRSRAYGLGKPTEEALALEYKVTDLLDSSSFMANPQGDTSWRETSVDNNRRWDQECYYWVKEDAKEDSRRCAIISDLADVTDRLRRVLESRREPLWLLPAEKMRPAYDAMAALLLAVADAEQEKEQADA